MRVAVAGEFFGHGVFALQIKEDWIGWFAKFGVNDPNIATQLLFLVGLLDLTVALIILVRPIRIALLWAVAWGFLDCTYKTARWYADLGFRRKMGQLGGAFSIALLSWLAEVV